MFIAAAFLPPPANFILGLAGPGIAVGCTLVYSYLAFRQVAR